MYMNIYINIKNIYKKVLTILIIDGILLPVVEKQKKLNKNLEN